MELKEIIKDYKNRTQYSNLEIGEQFQVTHITVGRWLRGEVKTIQDETAQKISAVLGYDVQAILQGKAVHLKRPILGQVKAGYDMFYESNYLGEESVTLDEFKQGDYFLNVVGDSMLYSGIKDGGIVYVKTCQQVENGEIAVVAIGQDEITIKACYRTKDKLILQASHPEVAPREFTNQQIRELPVTIIGKVIFSKNYL